MLPAVPVIDHCLLRRDSIAWGAGQDNVALGSFLFSTQIAPAAAIAAVSSLWTAPSNDNGTIITAAGGGGPANRFARAGWWRIRYTQHWTAAVTSNNVRLSFVPWDTRAKTFQLRPFQGVKAGPFTLAALTLTSGASQTREWNIDFETFFPEPWDCQLDTPTGLGVGDRIDCVLVATLECAMDDIPAAVDPNLVP